MYGRSENSGVFFSGESAYDWIRNETVWGGAVRPVVILKSSLTTKNLQKTDPEIEEKWTYSNMLGGG